MYNVHDYKYITPYNLLQESQSGFISYHCCQTSLVNSIDKLIEEMDNGNVTSILKWRHTLRFQKGLWCC